VTSDEKKLCECPEAFPEKIRDWIGELTSVITAAFDPAVNGHLRSWREAYAAIAEPSPDALPQLNQSQVRDGNFDPQDPEVWQAFHPWRKGPYQLGELLIDTEWRSDLKWDRLLHAIEPLPGRRCLDVGCGNGYHLWRMLGAGARLAVGLDPFLLYVYQFMAVQKRIPLPNIRVYPLGAEAIRPGLEFDTAFSMGVLSHCRDHAAHLQLLHQSLRPGGQLVLETLTVPEAHGPLFHPEGRYAQMRNIHALPDVSTLMKWLESSGFHSVRHVDTTRTDCGEQRATEWMRFYSLQNYLDPNDPSKTIEGHPAPQRSILVGDRSFG
jgi:tRNA (mo5U34)-methyltransferase